MTFVIVDLDNTFVDRVAAFRRWAAQFASDPAHVEQLVALDDDGYKPRPVFFNEVSELLGLNGAEVVSENYLAEYPASFELDPEIESAIKNLRAAGSLVVIASNGPPFQADVIRHTGLDQLVDGWAVSELEGVRKPDGRIAERMLRSLNANDREKVVIGDGAVDIELAHNLGARSVWVDRGRTWDATLGFAPSEITDSTAKALRLVT